MKRGQGAGGRGQGKEKSSLNPRPRILNPSLKRYARVAGAAAKVGAGTLGNRLTGGGVAREAALWRTALGGLKGPLMKVAQLLAAIPDFLPRELAAELATLQSDAPEMGWPFARRRLAVELGPDWQDKFSSFEKKAAFAASLGQVHRAVSLAGEPLACKLQYPDMESVVEADLRQLKLALGLLEKIGGAVRVDEVFAELSERLREELDYALEARNMALYGRLLADAPYAHVPRPHAELSTARLLCMDWLEGERFSDAAQSRPQAARNEIAANLFRLWYGPFYRAGVLHGDPHPGNYTIREDNSVNLLDFGCVRVFEPDLVRAVIGMFFALRDKDEAQEAECYRLWGFENPSKAARAALRHWAMFVYAPLLEDRVRPIEETNATAMGRQAALQVYKELQACGGVRVPRAFVLIDRASVGLGGVFLRLRAEVNWHRLFMEMVEGFEEVGLSKRQKALFLSSGFPPFTSTSK